MRMFYSFKGKLIVSIICLIIIVFVVLTYSILNLLFPQFLESQLDTQLKFAQLCSKAIMNWKYDMETISIDLATNSLVQDYLRLDAVKRNDSKEILEKTLSQIRNSEELLSDIWIVDKTMNIIGTGDPNAVRPYIMDRISSVLRSEGGPNWDSGFDTTSMILSRAVFDIKYDPNDLTGYLFMRIKNNGISNLFNEYRLYDSQRFSLKGITDGFEITEQGFFYNYYDNYADLVHVEIVFSPWYLRTWSTKSEAFSVPNTFIKNMGIIITCICLISCLLSIFLAQHLTKPISLMQDTFRKYSEGDFTAKVEIKGHDEIYELGMIANDMSDRISDLFERVKSEENTRRKLELQTLIYQINPHFLYNTLNSVSMTAISHDDTEVSEIVTDLSRLFRIGLHGGDDFIPVRDEIMHVVYYLRIQEKRFSDMLRWQIDSSDSLNDKKICKFILQPVVENAITYGVKPLGAECEVVIKGEEKGNEIIFEVIDYGLGMTTEELEKVRRRISSDKLPEGDGGFGLWNVNQRIKMYYGEKFGLTIFSEYGKGTRVVLTLGKKPVYS